MDPKYARWRDQRHEKTLLVIRVFMAPEHTTKRFMNCEHDHRLQTENRNSNTSGWANERSRSLGPCERPDRVACEIFVDDHAGNSHHRRATVIALCIQLIVLDCRV